ncbi:uncharacterized protein METZ01_LOCUS205181, partial [marine metagenome]
SIVPPQVPQISVSTIQPPIIVSPESEQLHKTMRVKLRISEEGIFTMDILISYSSGMQGRTILHINFN